MNYVSLLYRLFQLKSNAKKSREQILDIQNRKLRKVLQYAYEHSPYYHRVFNENGIDESNIATAPIPFFPIIDKTAFIENFDEKTKLDQKT